MENSNPNDVAIKGHESKAKAANSSKQRVSRKTTKSSIKVEMSTAVLIKEVKEKIEEKKTDFKVSADAIIYYALEKLNEGDFQKVFEASLSIGEKIELEYEKHCEKNDGSEFLTKDEWIAKKLKIQ